MCSNSLKLPLLNSQIAPGMDRPVKVLQYGEGNFLRGFADFMIDAANEKGIFNGNIVIVKPRNTGDLQKFYDQDCRYTVRLKGLRDSEIVTETRVITSVSAAVHPYNDFDTYINFASSPELRFIISNTTEAGIVFKKEPLPKNAPPDSFPGKLTQFLFARYKKFEGDTSKGLIILPTELIDANGSVLKNNVEKYITLWKLGENFNSWINSACVFTSTSVDRIITGFPQDPAPVCNELEYEDRLLVEGELFGSWIIESETDIHMEFPLDEAEQPVVFTDDLSPYKHIKVRILNGAHTSFVPASFLAGNDTVSDSMNDQLIKEFLSHTIFSEILPVIHDKKQEAKTFAKDVLLRFENPSIHHSLLDISLNSISKWKTRCLPSFLDYIETYQELPPHLTFSIAALLAFYSPIDKKENKLKGTCDGKQYDIMDDMEVLDFFLSHSKSTTEQLVSDFLNTITYEDTTLFSIPGLSDTITGYLDDIKINGMRDAIITLLQESIE